MEPKGFKLPPGVENVVNLGENKSPQLPTLFTTEMHYAAWEFSMIPGNTDLIVMSVFSPALPIFKLAIPMNIEGLKSLQSSIEEVLSMQPEENATTAKA